MQNSKLVLRLVLGCAVASVAVSGCRRAPKSGAAPSPAGKLQAETDRKTAPRTDPPLRPAAAAKPAPGPARAVPMAPARPVAAHKGKMPTIKPKAPTPFKMIRPGAQPRLALRYRFSNEEELVWRTTMEQLTHVRKEKQCPADLKAKLRGDKVRTIPMRYGVDLTTKATRAPDGLYRLDTRLGRISMTLPPALSGQKKILLRVLSNLSYTRRMDSRGKVTRFTFGKLTPRSLLRLSERLQAPLSHLQPMLPAAPVGVGAEWQHQRKHPLHQAGGRIDATYLTGYQVKAIRTQDGQQVVDLAMVTRIKMAGKLMGNEFRGIGSGTAQITLDAVRGVIRSAKGSLLICSAVKGRTSTNRTVFTQVLQSRKAPTPAPKKPTTPTKRPTSKKP